MSISLFVTLRIMTFSLAVMSGIMLSVEIFYWYAECHYADCRYAEYRGAVLQTNLANLATTFNIK
jgi:hypothetical protein